MACPPIKQHRPEGGDSGQDQKSEPHARALSLCIQTLHSNPHEGQCKYESKAYVDLKTMDKRFCHNFKHRCHRRESLLR
jgi:hypothetical protein